MQVVLIGLSGSGKTSVGKALSQILGWSFVDTDELIQAECGLSILEIFSTAGEESFRRFETVILESLLENMNDAFSDRIISTGGGVVLTEYNRGILKSLGKIVFLSAPVKTLAQRLSGDTARPLVASGCTEAEEAPLNERIELFSARLESMRISREWLYRQCDLTVETEGKDPENIACEIIHLLNLQPDEI